MKKAEHFEPFTPSHGLSENRHKNRRERRGFPGTQEEDIREEKRIGERRGRERRKRREERRLFPEKEEGKREERVIKEMSGKNRIE